MVLGALLLLMQPADLPFVVFAGTLFSGCQTPPASTDLTQVREDAFRNLLDAVVERIPAPEGDADAPLQALIFDSHFDQYRGVVSSIRVMNGHLEPDTKLRFMQAGATHDADEVGVRAPVPTPVLVPTPTPVTRRSDRRRSLVMTGLNAVPEFTPAPALSCGRNR